MAEEDAAVTKAAEGDMFWLWYPRGDAIAFGVWPSAVAACVGDGQWREDIPGWFLPLSPPQVELVFPMPECAPTLGIFLERDNDPDLSAAVNWVLGKGFGVLLHGYGGD